MSLLSSLSQGAYQKSSQYVGDVGDKIKRAYVPDTMSSMYGAGMFGQLLQSIRDSTKSQKKDNDKTQKTIERGYVDTRTVYLEMIKKLDSIDRTLKSGQKQNATTQQATGGDYTTGGGSGKSPMSPQKGGGDMLSSFLSFAKGNPLTTIMGAGGIAALIAKAVSGLANKGGGGGGNGGGDSDYSGPGLRNNPVTDLITDVGTGIAGLKVAKWSIGTAASGAWRQQTQKRAMMSALSDAQQSGMFGSPQSLGAPQFSGPANATSLGTNFEDAYARNRAAGMNPVDAKRAAGLEVRGTNFGQLAAKEAAMKPPIAAAPPTFGEKAAEFGSKAARVGGTLAKWGGTALGGLGVGMSAYDAYQKNKQGDTLGTWLSGGAAALGAGGMIATATGFGAVAGIPMLAGSALLSGIGAARDYIRGPEADATPEEKPSTAATGDASKQDLGFVPKDVLNDKAFMAEVERLSNKYKISQADLLAVMKAENDTFDPSRKNPRSTATGLIQFMADTAKDLGTTTGDLAKMNRAQQMKYVEKYFDMVGLPQGASRGQIYTAVFRPASLKQGGGDNAVLFSAGSAGYEANRGLDRAGKGSITVADLGAATDRATGKAGGTGSGSSGGGFTVGSDATIADAFGKNAGVLASSELAKLTGFLKEGFENIGNVNYNIDNSIRAAGGDPNASSRRTSAPNATRPA